MHIICPNNKSSDHGIMNLNRQDNCNRNLLIDNIPTVYCPGYSRKLPSTKVPHAFSPNEKLSSHTRNGPSPGEGDARVFFVLDVL